MKNPWKFPVELVLIVLILLLFVFAVAPGWIAQRRRGRDGAPPPSAEDVRGRAR